MFCAQGGTPRIDARTPGIPVRTLIRRPRTRASARPRIGPTRSAGAADWRGLMLGMRNISPAPRRYATRTHARARTRARFVCSVYCKRAEYMTCCNRRMRACVSAWHTGAPRFRCYACGSVLAVPAPSGSPTGDVARLARLHGEQGERKREKRERERGGREGGREGGRGFRETCAHTNACTHPRTRARTDAHMHPRTHRCGGADAARAAG
jgi:hypothetical protein